MSERELYLYVDGNLESPGPYDEDGLEGPKTPEAIGYDVVRTCMGTGNDENETEGVSCEEGMQVGGLYCCGGEGYSGKYFNGTIDEVRVWSRALAYYEVEAMMNTPLYAGDQECGSSSTVLCCVGAGWVWVSAANYHGAPCTHALPPATSSCSMGLRLCCIAMGEVGVAAASGCTLLRAGVSCYN